MIVLGGTVAVQHSNCSRLRRPRHSVGSNVADNGASLPVMLNVLKMLFSVSNTAGVSVWVLPQETASANQCMNAGQKTEIIRAEH
ncbi:hypothetical protein LSAT2_032669 [Lamellibrachia satsuma]|nr:hypothetical protein LSAT2_032669 [Lamellibrachia satsuma]